MADALDEIIKNYYSSWEQTNFTREKLEAGAKHIYDLLQGTVTQGGEGDEALAAEALAEAGGTLATAAEEAPLTPDQVAGKTPAVIIDNFFKRRSWQQRLAFLKAMTADPRAEKSPTGVAAKEALPACQKVIADREKAYTALVKELEKEALPLPKAFAANANFKVLADVLDDLTLELEQVQAKGGDPSLEELEDLVGRLFRHEDAKVGRLAILKYCYKLAQAPGIKKYFSGRFGEERKAAEVDLAVITEKNLREFQKLSAL